MTEPGAGRAAPRRVRGARRSALPGPFRIGVRPFGDGPWLRTGDDLDAVRADKAALHARDPRAVHRRVGDDWDDGSAEPVDAALLDATALAGEETLALVRGALDAAGHAPPATGPTPLARAALGVAEDLATLVRDASGWRLVEAFVAAPSAWALGDKIGRALGDVHGPVPDFATGTSNDRTVTRMFDALRDGAPVVRGSWSLHANARRFLPRHAPDHAARLAAAPIDALHLRAERQTLRRLPASGATLFTIDTTIRPVASLDGAERAALESQLAAMTPEQRRYRGLPDGAGAERGPDAVIRVRAPSTRGAVP